MQPLEPVRRPDLLPLRLGERVNIVAVDCTWDHDAGWVCPDPDEDEVVQYFLDAVGNVDSVFSSAGDTMVGSYSTGNRMDSFDGCNYLHDDNGSITRRACGADTVRFHWSADQKLIAYKVVGDDSVDFAYDAKGRLVKRDRAGGAVI